MTDLCPGTAAVIIKIQSEDSLTHLALFAFISLLMIYNYTNQSHLDEDVIPFDFGSS